MEIRNSIKAIYLRLKKVKNIEYFIFILAIAIVISVFSNLFEVKEEGGEMEAVSNAAVTSPEPSEEQSSDMETRLKNVLSAIRGAGRVEVMITYKTGKEIIPAMNTVESSTETEEHDSNGGIRKVNQTDINTQPVSLTTPDGSQPLITREIEPEVKGVIVVAEGAGDIRVRMELQQAVQTVLGVHANQVEVFVMDVNKTEE